MNKKNTSDNWFLENGTLWDVMDPVIEGVSLKVTNRMRDSHIHLADPTLVGDIEGVISFFIDIIAYCSTEEQLKDVLNDDKVYNECLYLDSIFSDIDNRDFSSPELRFIWSQIAHIVQPFRNLKTTIDGVKWSVSLKAILEPSALETIEKIKKYGGQIITRLQKYRDLCAQESFSPISIMDFERRFKECLWKTDVQFQFDIHDTKNYGMHPVTFQILLDNLVSNYHKYGREWVFILSSIDGKMSITFENKIKTDQERWDVLSSSVGNILLQAMVEEVLSWKVSVEKDEERYKITISEVSLSHIKNIRS